MKMIRHALAGLVVVAMASSAAMAALTIGDNAPAITVSKWVKGEPVKGFEKGKIYVMEFWATWCGPCKVSIPHLTELAHKYKDVTFVGTSVWENDDKEVEPFVKEMGAKMDYRVAMDDKSKEQKGAMAAHWMDAAAQEGIPTAFVVGKEGKIVWIGHPMELEPVLEKVVAGTFDVAAAKAAFEKEQKETLLTRDLQEEFEKTVMPSIQKKDYAAALKATDEIIAKHEPSVWIQGMKFTVAARAKDWKAAYAAVDAYAGLSNDNAGALNNLAWQIATDEAVEKRDLDRALKYALRAVELTKGEEANALDTLARVYFERGEAAKAVETEEKAVARATGDEKVEVTKNLEGYKAKVK